MFQPTPLTGVRGDRSRVEPAGRGDMVSTHSPHRSEGRRSASPPGGTAGLFQPTPLTGVRGDARTTPRRLIGRFNPLPSPE